MIGDQQPQAEYRLIDAWRALARGWNHFFHAPQDTRVCAAVRIGMSLVLLVNLAVLYPDLTTFLTDDGILSTDMARQIGRPYAWSILFWLPSTPQVVETCFWIYVAHTLLLLIGCLSRINAAAALVWFLSFQYRNSQILDGEDTVMRLVLFYLVMMPCGANWSVDALVTRWLVSKRTGKPPGAANHLRPAWGLRLLQIQMAVIFLTAALYKIANEQWFYGTAMYYVARLDDYFGKYPVPDWLFDSPRAVAIITWAVVAGELLIPVFIWFRETRRICLLLAVLFHLGNEWTMHLFLFHWVMLVGWLSFVRPEDFAWLKILRTASPRSLAPADS
jgi:hypothetical protein